MSIKNYPLGEIDPNPWQPRSAEDPDHIRELAESIRSDGLLQTPLGRLVDGRVQLAAGHSRLAAFRLLDAGAAPGFDTLPVSIRTLTDEQMFRLAIAENLRRRDLTPLDEARAMLRYRDEFGKSVIEIGELFGVGESAVRNKIRLLNLPEDLLPALEDGRMSEGAGRALLTLFDLPEDLRKRAQNSGNSWSGNNTPKRIVAAALEGEKAETIVESIESMIQRQGQDLSAATWKHTQKFEGENIHHPDCKTCPQRLKNGKKFWCLVPACFKAKREQTHQAYMQAASEASGYPVGPEGVGYYQLTDLHGDVGKKLFKKAKKDGCPNLGLIHDASKPWNAEHVRLKTHPDVEIICTKRSGHCTCLKAMKAGVAMTPQNGELREADLKAARAEIKAEQRRKWALSRELETEARARISQALAENKLEALRMFLGREVSAKFREVKTEAELGLALAEYVIHRQTSYYNRDEVEKLQKRLNELLAEAGLEPVNISAEMAVKETEPEEV